MPVHLWLKYLAICVVLDVITFSLSYFSEIKVKTYDYYREYD